tara:strand:- start:16445 stop:17575 length:1131 start_codon:yes stop_codon:yes gene_type:complete
MEFKLIKKDIRSNARAGVLNSSVGKIETPIFMPVGTQASVKGIDQKILKEQIDSKIILTNTYHLFLRPGTNVIKNAGGIHKFMNWDRIILTDSGGYQVYSLSNKRKITERGVLFNSHIDGRKHLLTPESVIEIQREIGADIIMAFDECPPYPSKFEYVKSSMQLTHRWLDRCIEMHKNTPFLFGKKQILFPIIQGGVFNELRKESTNYVLNKFAKGYAVGGLSVGEPNEEMYKVTDLVCSILPSDKPRYLMGVGTPVNLLENISNGIDMFDCVIPTRNGRNGMLFTYDGIINIKNKKWKNDHSKIQTEDNKKSENQYSKAYLRHLFMANEILGGQIAALHNLNFYKNLLKTARQKILNGDFSSWKNAILKTLNTKI